MGLRVAYDREEAQRPPPADVPGAVRVFSTTAVTEIRDELHRSRAPLIDFFDTHLRTLDKADLVLLAPSRCGKTPTTMYLALQHGLLVANDPLVDEDLETDDLPRPVREMGERCFGIVTTPRRLAELRQQRRPGSTYSSLETCTRELRRARAMFAAHGLPVVDSSARSVEEVSAVILQHLARKR